MQPKKTSKYLRNIDLKAELEGRQCFKFKRLVSSNIESPFWMPRRKQLKGVSQNILESFASRWNDLDGFCALGQYVNFLMKDGTRKLVFDLKNGRTTPNNPVFDDAARYYWQAILYIMRQNKMPEQWLQNATITFALKAADRCNCEIILQSDQGKSYSHSCTVFVLPHNPLNELRRGEPFGASNARRTVKLDSGFEILI